MSEGLCCWPRRDEIDEIEDIEDIDDTLPSFQALSGIASDSSRAPGKSILRSRRLNQTIHHLTVFNHLINTPDQMDGKHDHNMPCSHNFLLLQTADVLPMTDHAY